MRPTKRATTGSSGSVMRPVMGMSTSKSHDETECKWRVGSSAPTIWIARAAVGACARWQSAEASRRARPLRPQKSAKM